MPHASKVTFYLGRAGAGKTHALYESMRRSLEQNRRVALIVPEQFTYETERALSLALGGLLGVEVLSLSRLVDRVAGDKPYLSNEGRCMVIRRVAYRLRSKLMVYGPVATRGGFAVRMNELFSKLKQYMIEPQDLLAAAAGLDENSLLAKKLNDIALLYESMQEYMAERYIDSEDAVNALRENLPNSFLAGADVFFDEFEEANEQFYTVVEGLMANANAVSFTICLDPGHDHRDYSLFAPGRRIYERLRDMAAALNCNIFNKELEVFVNRDPALVRLEQELYAYPPRTYAGNADAIKLVGASDRIAEVESLADAVAKAAREGVRYREMAVIASDLNAYMAPVQRAFEKRGIPLFLDVKRSMRGHPVVELLLSAARAATSGYSRNDLVRIIKTGLLPVSQNESDAFENYCLKRGLLGGQTFLKPFPEEEEEAELARLALMEPLENLRSGLLQKQSGEKTKALYSFLEQLNIQAQLNETVNRLREQNRLTLMEEHAQVWGKLVEMLEQLYAILGDTEISSREYIVVLNEAVAAYQVGVIPAAVDEVLFGDVARTRSRNVKRLFILGCNEGLLPPPQSDDGVIDDAELVELKSSGRTFWQQSSARAEGDRLAIYRALSKVSQQLYLSFAYSDGKRELIPAELIERVLEIFPSVCISAPPGGELPATAESGFIKLTRELKNEAPLFKALKLYYKADPEYSPRLKLANDFAHAPATPKSLGSPLSAKLYGKNYYGSISRLQTFRECPYRHFLQHGLKVSPRREFKERKSDVGSFSHIVLEIFVQQVLGLQGGFDELTLQKTNELLDDIFPDCLESYENGLLLGSPRARTLSVFWMEAVRKSAWALVNSIQAGDFVPVYTEAKFGANGDYPPLDLPLGQAKGQLSGLIDRVDKTKTGSLLRVVDYKTGKAKIDYKKIYDGLSLQLPLYLKVVADNEAALPAGMFYQPVKNPVVDEGKEEGAFDALRLSGLLLSDEQAVEATERALAGKSQVVQGLSRNANLTLHKRSHVLEGEELSFLMEFALSRAAKSARELLDGKVEARPVSFGGNSSACSYCDYKSVCRFDKRQPGCHVRELPNMDKETFFAQCEKKEEP